MLSVVVQPSVSPKVMPGGPENFRKVKISAPNIASGTEPARTTIGSRNELNCAASTRKMSRMRQAHGGQELAALLAQLARLAGVVEAASPGGRMRAAAVSSTCRPPSSDCGATPEIFTAFSCWKRLSVRGSTPVAEAWRWTTAGSACPLGPVTWISPSSFGVRRPARSTWAITL